MSGSFKSDRLRALLDWVGKVIDLPSNHCFKSLPIYWYLRERRKSSAGIYPFAFAVPLAGAPGARSCTPKSLSFEGLLGLQNRAFVDD
jgi:hypothetical protein